MTEWVLAAANIELANYVKEVSRQSRKKIEITEVKDMEHLLRVITHSHPDVLVLNEIFLNHASAEDSKSIYDDAIISCVSKIRYLSNVRIIFFAPGRRRGDPVLDFIIRECGIYDLFLDSEIDGKRLQSVLFNPQEKCSVTHLMVASSSEEVLYSSEELGCIGQERQKKILRNILNDISQKDFRDILDDIPSDIKSRLVKHEVVEKEIIREVPRIIIKNSVKVIERLKIQKQQIIAFWSPKDNQGRSHMLTQLSLLLRQQTEARILAVDLDFANPSLDMYFELSRKNHSSYVTDDSSPVRNLVEAAESKKINLNVLRDNINTTKHGLDIIYCNPYDIRRIETTGKNIVSLIETAAELYDYIFLDLPVLLENEATAAALKKSNSILIISEGELTALRSLNTRLLSHRELFPEDKCKIIINKAIPGILEEREIKDYLGMDMDISYIPFNERCIASILQQKNFIYSCSRKEQKPYRNMLEKLVNARKG